MPAKKERKKEIKKKSIPKRVIQRARKVKVNVAKEVELSPYVVYLSNDLPDPSKMIEDETKVTAANFVDYVSLLDDQVLLETVADDLAIGEQELLGQLKENDLITQKTLIERLLSLPKLPKIKLAIRKDEALNNEPEDVLALDPVISEVIEEAEKVEEMEEKEQVADYVFAINNGQPNIIEQVEEEVEEIIEEIGDTARQWSWQLEHGWKRAIAGFVLVSFVFVLPLHAMSTYKSMKNQQAELTQSGEQAVAELGSAADSLLNADFSDASADFTRANSEFKNAQSTLEDVDSTLKAIIQILPATRKAYNTGVDLIKAGDLLSRAASQISQAFATIESELSPTLTTKIAIMQTTLEHSLPLITEAEDHLSKIDLDVLPDQAKDMISTLAERLPGLTDSLSQFLDFADLANIILGSDQKMRYLVIFQNNTELRPTGGFIGSFAELDIYQGAITKVTVPAGGSYDLQGSLRDYIIAPEPLQLLNARWEFQDVNWFPDFPTSANKLTEFYQAAGGPSVDGVIAVNASYMADLIAMLGPVDMPEYDRTITGENFIFEAQKIIDQTEDQTTPKQFIADLAPEILDRVSTGSAQDFLATLNHLNQGLSEKDIQLYFTDHQLEQQITELGWAGEIKRMAGDYLMVVTTNLGGGKTDMIVSENIDLQVNIDSNGEIINTVTITRTHHGLETDLFEGDNNVDYVRLYVPRGSQLISAQNFEIPPAELFDRPPAYYQEDEDLSFASSSSYIDPLSGTVITEEFGKTSFGNWIQTKPGETEVATFTYRLPWKLEALSHEYDLVAQLKDKLGFHPIGDYSLNLQKQSGVTDRQIQATVHLPDNLELIWSSSANIDDQTIHLTADETKDVFLGILFETDI